MSKHTAGPWRFSETYGVFSETDAYSSFVADCRVGHTDRRKANARLIAAAPELLEALRGLELAQAMGTLGMFGNNEANSPWVAARSAIAKATGAA